MLSEGASARVLLPSMSSARQAVAPMANSSGWLKRNDRARSGLGYSRSSKGSSSGAGISRAAPTCGTTLFRGGCLRCGGGTDPEGLDVHELADAEARELASETRLLHAAER